MSDRNLDNIELIKRYREGDEKAKDLLVKRNIKLVFLVVNKFYSPKHDRFEDAVSVGTLGFLKAIKSFDVNGETSFFTYAYACISNELMMYYNKIKRPKHNPKGMVLSMDTFETDEGESMNLHDFVPDISAENPEMKSVQNSQIETLKKLMPIVLTETEQKAMSLVLQNEEITQAEIADQLGFTQAYVSKIIKSSYKKLKNAFDELENIDEGKAKTRETTGEKSFKDSLEIFRARHAKISRRVGKTDVKTK